MHGDPRRPAVAAKGSAPAAFARREQLAAPHALLGRFFCRGLALGTRNSRQGRSDFQSLQEEKPTGATSCDRPFPVFAFQTHRPIGGERVLDEVRTCPARHLLDPRQSRARRLGVRRRHFAIVSPQIRGRKYARSIAGEARADLLSIPIIRGDNKHRQQRRGGHTPASHPGSHISLMRTTQGLLAAPGNHAGRHQ